MGPLLHIAGGAVASAATAMPLLTLCPPAVLRWTGGALAMGAPAC